MTTQAQIARIPECYRGGIELGWLEAGDTYLDTDDNKQVITQAMADYLVSEYAKVRAAAAQAWQQKIASMNELKAA